MIYLFPGYIANCGWPSGDQNADICLLHCGNGYPDRPNNVIPGHAYYWKGEWHPSPYHAAVK